MWRLRVVIAVLVVLAAGACGVVGDQASPGASTPGASPSESAQMICAEEAQSDIAKAVGVTPQTVGPPTWQDQLYSCRYVYPDGSLLLSVKELAGDGATSAYLADLERTLGKTGTLGSLGAGAFTTSAGSVVVPKDNKVLLVDTTRLPAAFGDPSMTPAAAARGVAVVILGCWTGV